MSVVPLLLRVGLVALTATAVGSVAQAAPVAAAPTPLGVHRVCASARPGALSCAALSVPSVEPAALRHGGVDPRVTPAGYGPADLRSAYTLTLDGGRAQTVAVVDAFDDPNAEADLAAYRTQYGLPACSTTNGCFLKVNQQGQTAPLPDPDASWAAEISLDLDMVSAICPYCHILLVEASSDLNQDLGTAVDRAVLMGAKFVSNSYYGPEQSVDRQLENTYYNHPGVAVTVATGDSGYGSYYPSNSKYVTAVGGTSLSRGQSGGGWVESAWDGGGGGCSAVIAKPADQANVTTRCQRRASSDVSAVADPSTPVAVYDTYTQSGWITLGGTSVATPIIAAAYAKNGDPNPGDYPSGYPYRGVYIRDITKGSNGSCTPAVWCKARTGWDGPTGVGTPEGALGFAPPIPSTCQSRPLLTNTGFEQGPFGWSNNGHVIGQWGSGAVPHSGTWSAWLDGTGTTQTSTLTRYVQIPAQCRAVKLSFYLHIDTAETGGPADTMQVSIGPTVVATYDNTQAAAGYVKRTLTLPPRPGSTLQLSFVGNENASHQTSFVLDDLSLVAA